ncbi:MAG: translocation/assembly module TamB, partial [Neisseria sp.]
VVPSFTHGIALDGSLDLENKAAGFADDKAIPVRNILADFTINDNGVVTVQESEIGLLEEGSFNVAGTVDTVKNALALKINVNNLVSDDLVRTNVAGQWNGFIGVKGETASPAIDWNLESGSAQLSGLLSFVTDRQHGQRTLKLDRVRVAPQNGGELTAQGSLELFKDRLLKLDVSSKAFNPSRLDSKLPAGSVNGTINLSGELAKEKFAGKMQFAPSTLNNV